MSGNVLRQGNIKALMELTSFIFNKINIGGGNHFLIASFCFSASNYGFCRDWTFFDALFSLSCFDDSAALPDKEMS